MKTKNIESKPLIITLLSLFTVGVITIISLPENKNNQKDISEFKVLYENESSIKTDYSNNKIKSPSSNNTSELKSETNSSVNTNQKITDNISVGNNKTSETKIIQLTISSDIIEREPVDDLEKVDLNIGKFYTHTVVNSNKVSEIQHVYYFDNKEIARVPMQIGKSPSWRCWSSKYIDPKLCEGEWRVDIENNIGTVIASKTFNINNESKETIPLAEQFTSLP